VLTKIFTPNPTPVAQILQRDTEPNLDTSSIRENIQMLPVAKENHKVHKMKN